MWKHFNLALLKTKYPEILGKKDPYLLIKAVNLMFKEELKLLLFINDLPRMIDFDR